MQYCRVKFSWLHKIHKIFLPKIIKLYGMYDVGSTNTCSKRIWLYVATYGWLFVVEDTKFED